MPFGLWCESILVKYVIASKTIRRPINELVYVQAFILEIWNAMNNFFVSFIHKYKTIDSSLSHEIPSVADLLTEEYV